MAPLSRFERSFELVVNDVSVLPPLRVAFQADKSIDGALNKIRLRVYNLAERNRLAIAKDEDETRRVPLSLRVGYRGSLRLVFKGTVTKAGTSREGPDIVTNIEGLDGGFDFLTSFTSRTVRGKSAAIDAILRDMPNTARGKIAPQAELVRPKVLVGNSAKLIEQQIGPDETWYIDNEQLNIIGSADVTGSFAPLVSAETGLIDTPQRDKSEVTFRCMIDPTIKIGGLCELRSLLNPALNGLYRVKTISYSGDNYGSDWSQTVTGTPATDYRVL